MVLLGLSIHPVRLEADSIPPPKVLTKADLTSLVNNYAKEYDVSPRVMTNVIDCEDTTWSPTKQSDIVKDGRREESYGLAQINLPDNPDVTLSQAQDPNFAIQFMAKKLSEGKGNLWTCYRTEYN